MTTAQLLRVQPGDVLAFWQDAGPSRWFRKDAVFDRLFKERFLPAHDQAARGDLDDWRESAKGCLALVLLLDQFPRNAFRDTPRMYATDALAREVAAHAVDRGFDSCFEPDLRHFLYLPFMHSEQLQDQDRCVALSRSVGGEGLRYALHHRQLIERFGRFPHRNALLGRSSTPEELDFLASGGFGG